MSLMSDNYSIGDTTLNPELRNAIRNLLTYATCCYSVTLETSGSGRLMLINPYGFYTRVTLGVLYVAWFNSTDHEFKHIKGNFPANYSSINGRIIDLQDFTSYEYTCYNTKPRDILIKGYIGVPSADEFYLLVQSI